MPDKIRVIVTGVTGMVGEGVLHECLQHPAVEAVLIINRKPSGFSHPKLKEIVHEDFFNITSLAPQLEGYDGCFFCLGVTSLGKNEETYYRLTYTLTLHVAEVMSKASPQMAFCYISGSGTDSSENGRVMWARVKGKTENDLMKLPFRAVYAFRPGILYATKGAKNVPALYKFVSWLYPLLGPLIPSFAGTLAELGQAMIKVTMHGYGKKVLEVKDIRKVAKEY
ncbi:NAD-dependent epimerase/dehydratase family protein [Chitinophaga sp. GCM10012297]|uniref:NAD-dependent epimerase/dehydratase family protein n=1 Tax=Chitinophaga chungangae TaxID=2821488 RepID=A0ABS3Y996_9BACT|nr:NAD-dependent epimerase/dehydratase family protein [Chitinophaga chungangae]MBO9151244.1 NAD-dependent epimerase/dehydratase family protein [Chitinophaga chungangae]